MRDTSSLWPSPSGLWQDAGHMGGFPSGFSKKVVLCRSTGCPAVGPPAATQILRAGAGHGEQGRSGWGRSGPGQNGPGQNGPEPSGPEPSGPEPSGPEPSGPEPSGPEPSGPERNSGRPRPPAYWRSPPGG